MKNYRLYLLITATFLITAAQVRGQMPGITIFGMLSDSSTGKPLEFATVTITKQGDSTFLTGALTDATGKYTLSIDQPGEFILQYYFVGYKIKRSNISITPGKPFVDAGKIVLVQDGELLDAVQITAEKGYFQGSIDKKVYNIEKDIIASNGSAAEALQTIPSVVIDIDGNISLRGNEGVRIFIDGKPSGIAGNNMAAILEQIPASTIESIEVVTNPSARYDAEGNSGIINIVLKKNKKIGLNGNVYVGASTAPRYEAGGSLNYRNQKCR